MKKTIIIIFAIMAAVLVSCTDRFEAFNTNAHEATYEQMLTDDNLTSSLFQQIERSVIFYRDGTGVLDSDYQIEYNLCSETWAGYMAPTLGNGVNNGSFYINDSWSRSLYINKYSLAMNAYVSLAEVCEDGGLDHVLALANVLKVAAMHQVADYYGPVPYSECGSSLTPTYDSLESIYNQMLTELDDAIDVLTEYNIADDSATIMADVDLVYSGDVATWIRFANSLRLRLAMRCVYADASLAQTEAEKSISDSYGLITDNSDNAIVSGIDHHPLYEINVNFNDGDTQMNACLDCYLNGYDDPRTFCIVKAANDGLFHGVRNGIQVDSWDAYHNTNNNVSAPNATEYNLTWLNAAEVYFLLAEAALRGWNVDGTAQEYYEAGVTASFNEWGASGVASYLADDTSTPTAFVDVVGSAGTSAPSSITIAWDDSADFETSLERIMTQKWIALFPNGPEGWAEYRRTGYPHLLTPANNESNGIVDSDLQIRRVPYPLSEYTDNPTGVSAGVTALGGLDNAGTKLWWDKRDR